MKYVCNRSSIGDRKTLILHQEEYNIKKTH
jgi:hypothetical protein